MQFLFTTPVVRPSFDGGATQVRGIEDNITGVNHTVVVTGLTGATTMNQLIASVKAQVATALGVTFQ